MSLKLINVKGGTVIEVVIALLIVSLSIALTGMLFASFFDASQRMVKQQAWYDVENYCNRLKLEKVIESAEIDRGPYTIVSNVEQVNEFAGVICIEVFGIDQDGDRIVMRKFYLESEFLDNN